MTNLIVTGNACRAASALAGRLVRMGCEYAPPEVVSAMEGVVRGEGEEEEATWERVDVSELNEGLLRACGCAWEDPYLFRVDGISSDEIKSFHRRASGVIAGFSGEGPWMMKDAHFALTLPIWEAAFETPVMVVVVYEEPGEFARRLVREQGIPSSVGMALWEYRMCHLLNACRRVSFVCVERSDLEKYPASSGERIREALEGAGVEGLRVVTSEAVGVETVLGAEGVYEVVLTAGHARLLEFLRGSGELREGHDERFEVGEEAMRELEAHHRTAAAYHGRGGKAEEAALLYTEGLERWGRVFGKLEERLERGLGEAGSLEKLLGRVDDGERAVRESGLFSKARWGAAFRVLRKGAERGTARVLKEFREGKWRSGLEEEKKKEKEKKKAGAEAGVKDGGGDELGVGEGGVEGAGDDGEAIGYEGEGAVVAVGSWRGDGLRRLVRGLSGNGDSVVTVCDSFRWEEWKAERDGGVDWARAHDLEVGESVIPALEKELSGDAERVETRVMDLRDEEWEGGAIGLLAVGATEAGEISDAVWGSYFSRVIPGKGVVVLGEGEWGAVGSIGVRFEKYFERVAGAELVWRLREVLPDDVLEERKGE